MNALRVAVLLVILACGARFVHAALDTVKRAQHVAHTVKGAE